MSRVIVSFTSIPARMDHLMDVVHNMCRDQTQLPTHVRLYVPPCLHRSNAEYVVPQALADLQTTYPFFNVVRVPKDKGPATKVIYALQEFTRPSDLVISIDDDIIYHKQFVQEMVAAHATLPHSLLGFMGTNPPVQAYIHAEFLQRSTGSTENRGFYKSKTLGGYRGILYPRNLVNDDFFELFETLSELTLTECKSVIREDDNFVAMYCEHKQIPMHVIGTFFPGNMQSTVWLERLNFQFRESGRVDALFGEQNFSSTMNTFVILRDFFAGLAKPTITEDQASAT